MSEKQPSQPKRRWSQFRLRTLLILITLASFVFGIYKPITLHFQAKQFFNIKSHSFPTRQHPGELFFDTFGSEDTALFQIGQVKIALLERRQDTRISTAGFIPIAGNTRQQKAYRSSNGYEYFSYSYADEQVECVAFDFPFRCSPKAIQINDQSFDFATPTVILVDTNDKILYTYSR